MSDTMKVKRLICPICGDYMVPIEFGQNREVISQYLSVYTNNFITASCNCGCELTYYGDKEIMIHSK